MRNVRLGSSPEVNANPNVGLLCASKRTPAQSPVGILAKIRAFYFEDERALEGWQAECEPIYEQEGVSELERKADEAWDAADAAETRFVETRARTVAGLLFKLRVGCQPRNYEVEYPAEGDQPSGPPAVLAVLRDLERMAGRAT